MAAVVAGADAVRNAFPGPDGALAETGRPRASLNKLVAGACYPLIYHLCDGYPADGDQRSEGRLNGSSCQPGGRLRMLRCSYAAGVSATTPCSEPQNPLRNLH